MKMPANWPRPRRHSRLRISDYEGSLLFQEEVS
jgi:hypothetical protein